MPEASYWFTSHSKQVSKIIVLWLWLVFANIAFFLVGVTRWQSPSQGSYSYIPTAFNIWISIKQCTLGVFRGYLWGNYKINVL